MKNKKRKPATLWDNDEMQFMRLLAEMQGAINDTAIETAAFNMDLTREEVLSIMDRAVEAWEFQKDKLLKQIDEER